MLVVALDAVRELGNLESLLGVVESVHDYVSGFKIGIGVLLKHGLSAISAVKEISSREVVADLKLADIGDVMASTLELLASSGVDAVIAHGFVGISGALEKLVEEAEKRGVKLILVVSMSHKGSEKYIDKHFDELLEDSIQLGASGVVVPATKPHLITRARRVLGGRARIYSPGVGVQGARPGDALCAGADYEIIGRLVTTAPDPLSAVKSVVSAQLERVRACRGFH